MPVDDIMLTNAELEARQRKRKRWIIAGSAVVLLILAIVFLGKPTVHAIKAWQARRHAKEAFALMDKEQWNDARKEATAAFQLWREEPEAIRAVARFLSRTRQSQALEFWDLLEKQGRLNRGDLVDEASIALLAGDETRARRAITGLKSGKFGAPKPVDHLLGAQLALRQGAPIEARDSLQKVFADPAATSREKLQAAMIEAAISAGNDEWRNDAWSWLKKVGDGTDSAALDALSVLAQTLVQAEKPPEQFPITALELAGKLEAHPLARAPQKLLAIDLQIREQKDSREVLIAKATEQWKAAPEAEDVAALAAWLNSKGEFQRQLDAIPLEKALQSRDIFLQHVDALGGLGRWKEIKDLLDTERFPLDPVIQKMYLARTNAQLGEKAASENNWQRALEAAHGDPQKLLMLASYAEKNAALDIAGAAYNEAAAEAPKLRAAHQGRLRLAQATRDTKKIHDVLAEMLVTWPNDPAVQNDEAYTRLLLLMQDQSEAGSTKEEAGKIEELAAKLVEREPASLPHRSLLALARLRLGKYSDAMDTYSNIQVARNALTPSALAVHAAVLAANGKAEDAANEASSVDPNTLLPEEARLVETLKR